MELQRDRPADDPVPHELKNHIAMVISFCDLLLADLSEDDPTRKDILQVRKAGHAAMARCPELSPRTR